MHSLVPEHGRVLHPLQDAQAVPCEMLVLASFTGLDTFLHAEQ